ncbi:MULTISPECIES: DUF397 domain-containing protein [unclassified Streptomyces]|uniref:DUF397 domain-containing protein n=1 Tax=unclassified Streptomyces TaxID=2593676 RepID=UPI0033C4BF01
MTTDLNWFKSSYSGSEGECVELAVQWTKSSHSGDQGECVEIAIAETSPTDPATIHIRDSKIATPTAPTLKVAPKTWLTFLGLLAER